MSIVLAVISIIIGIVLLLLKIFMKYFFKNYRFETILFPYMGSRYCGAVMILFGLMCLFLSRSDDVLPIIEMVVFIALSVYFIYATFYSHNAFLCQGNQWYISSIMNIRRRRPLKKIERVDIKATPWYYRLGRNAAYEKAVIYVGKKKPITLYDNAFSAKAWQIISRI